MSNAPTTTAVAAPSASPAPASPPASPSAPEATGIPNFDKMSFEQRQAQDQNAARRK